jgi:hypothetical protein
MGTPSAPQLPPVNIQFGVPIDQSSISFFAVLAVAILIVYLFCKKKFAEPSRKETDDFVYSLRPDQLATPEEYSRGFKNYLMIMVLAVVFLSLIGPGNLRAVGLPVPADTNFVAVPLAVALMLVGLLPNVQVLEAIELRLRQYAHERARIPTAARETARILSTADFDFLIYQEALESGEMRGVEKADFSEPRGTLEHDWARFSALIYCMKLLMSDPSAALDHELLRSYQRELEGLEDKRNSMEAEVARYRATKAAAPNLHATIRSSLYKLYILLGCAVRANQTPHRYLDQALLPYGFKLPHDLPQPRNPDLLLVAVMIVGSVVLFVEFGAVAAAHLSHWLGWFSFSDVFPQDWYQPFVDMINLLMVYGAAVFTAERVRAYYRRKHAWFQSAGPRLRPNTANYIRVGLACGVAGYVALVLGGGLFQGFTLTWLKMAAPFFLLPAIAGAFYACHLDNAELGTRPHRLFEVGSQAVIAGICGLIAATASFAIAIDDPSPVFDQITLTAVLSAAIGAALAWYVPSEAANSRDSLQADAGEARAAVAETATLRRVGSPSTVPDGPTIYSAPAGANASMR